MDEEIKAMMKELDDADAQYAREIASSAANIEPTSSGSVHTNAVDGGEEMNGKRKARTPSPGPSPKKAKLEEPKAAYLMSKEDEEAVKYFMLRKERIRAWSQDPKEKKAQLDHINGMKQDTWYAEAKAQQFPARSEPILEKYSDHPALQESAKSRAKEETTVQGRQEQVSAS